jgi:phosphoserine phosphatase RsbU/P
VAIENARLYEAIRANEERLEKELRFAQRVQMALLPQELPKRLKGVDVAWHFAPGARAGRRLPRLPLARVEHAGRGRRRRVGQGRAGGALQRVRGRAGARAHLPAPLPAGRSSPAGVLSSINTILHERQLEEYYCTLCYAMFDLRVVVVKITA